LDRNLTEKILLTVQKVSIVWIQLFLPAVSGESALKKLRFDCEQVIPRLVQLVSIAQVNPLDLLVLSRVLAREVDFLKEALFVLDKIVKSPANLAVHSSS